MWRVKESVGELIRDAVTRLFSGCLMICTLSLRFQISFGRGLQRWEDAGKGRGHPRVGLHPKFEILKIPCPQSVCRRQILKFYVQALAFFTLLDDNSLLQSLLGLHVAAPSRKWSPSHFSGLGSNSFTFWKVQLHEGRRVTELSSKSVKKCKCLDIEFQDLTPTHWLWAGYLSRFQAWGWKPTLGGPLPILNSLSFPIHPSTLFCPFISHSIPIPLPSFRIRPLKFSSGSGAEL